MDQPADVAVMTPEWFPTEISVSGHGAGSPESALKESVAHPPDG